MARACRGVVSFVACAAVVTACSGAGGGSAAPPSSSAGPATTSSPPATTVAVRADDVVRLLTEPSTMPSLRISPDATRAASAPVTASGATVTVSDAAGGTFELTLPAEAAPLGTVITVTPLASIAGDRPGWVGGVLFGPDGLQLSGRAALSYRPPSASGPVTLYTMDDDGGSVAYARVDTSGRALLEHFSGAAAGPPTLGGDQGATNSNASPACSSLGCDVAGAAATYDALLKAVEAGFPDSPLNKMPAIEDRVPSACASANDAVAVERLAAAIRFPWVRDESTLEGLYHELLGLAARNGGLGDLDRDFAARTDHAHDLLRTYAADDARRFVETLDATPDHGVLKYRLLSEAAAKVLVPNASGVGVKVPDETKQALSTWRGHVGQVIVDRIGTEHWYSALSALVAWGLLDDTLAARLTTALRFTAAVDFKLDELAVFLQDTARLTVDDLAPTSIPRAMATPLVVELSGSGAMDSAEGTATDYAGPGTGHATIAPNHTPTKVTVRLDVCALTMRVDATPWGTPETVTMVMDGTQLAMPFPGTGMWDSGIRTGILHNPGGLTVTAADRQAAANGSVSLGYREGDSSVNIDATITITHRPG